MPHVMNAAEANNADGPHAGARAVHRPQSRRGAFTKRSFAVVLADDLTGALAVGALLRSRGVRVSLALNPDTTIDTDSDALVINTRTRDLSSNEARRVVVESVERARQAICRPIHWHKRIDTTLKGPIWAETEALVTILGIDSGVLAPAFPEAGRVTSAGVHFVDGKAVGQLDQLLRGAVGSARISIGTQTDPWGSGWWIPDIGATGDVETVAQRVLEAPDGTHLTIDSGLLVTELLAAERRGNAAVLVVQGSTSSLVQEQVAHLRLVSRSGVDVLYIPVEGPGDPRLADLVANALKQVTLRHYVGLVVGGGLTAEMLLAAACADQVEILGAPAPLTAIARVEGGQLDGMLFATKGGGVGPVDGLTRLVDLIRIVEDC